MFTEKSTFFITLFIYKLETNKTLISLDTNKTLISLCEEVKLVKTEIKNLTKNLDFFKDQNSQIISELKLLRKSIPSQSDIQKVSLEIESSKLKKVESEKLLEEVNSRVKSFEEKIEKGKFKEHSSDLNIELENITNLLQNLKLGSPKKLKPIKYKFWMPDNE